MVLKLLKHIIYETVLPVFFRFKVKDTSDVNVMKRGFACMVLRALGSNRGRNGWKISFYSRS